MIIEMREILEILKLQMAITSLILVQFAQSWTRLKALDLEISNLLSFEL